MSKRDLITVWAIGFLLGLAVIMLTTFSMAYANGGQVLVAIDRFGEAELELLVLHLFVTPTIAAGIYFLAKDG